MTILLLWLYPLMGLMVGFAAALPFGRWVQGRYMTQHADKGWPRVHFDGRLYWVVEDTPEALSEFYGVCAPPSSPEMRTFVVPDGTVELTIKSTRGIGGGSGKRDIVDDTDCEGC